MNSEEKRKFIVQLSTPIIEIIRARNRELSSLCDRKHKNGIINKIISINVDINKKLVSDLEDIVHKEGISVLELTLVEGRIFSILYRHDDIYRNISRHFLESNLKEELTEFVYPSKKCFGVNIVFCPMSYVNYSTSDIGSYIRSRLLKLKMRDNYQLPDEIIMIHYPRGLIHNFLTHGMIFHEIAHFLYEKTGMKSKIYSVYKHLDDQNELFDDGLLYQLISNRSKNSEVGRNLLNALDSNDDSAPELLDLTNMKGESFQIINAWIEEIACDIMGYYIGGPFFFISFLNFCVYEIALPSEKHPPFKDRFGVLFSLFNDELQALKEYESNLFGENEEGQFFDVWRKRLEDSGGLETPTSGKETSSDKFFLELKYELLDKTFQGIIHNIVERIKEELSGASEIDLYIAGNHLEEVYELLHRLENFIIPNEFIDYESEKTVDVDFRSILFAGGLNLLRSETYWREDKFRNKLKNITAYREKINELVLKALEINEIQKRWGEKINGSPDKR